MSLAVNEFQPAMTEWLAAIGNAEESERFRAEDNTKAERLEVLYQEIGLAYERPVKFDAVDLLHRNKEFQQYLSDHGHELCAIRLVPKDHALPKIRQRGLSLEESFEHWFLQQAIDYNRYWAYIFPHSETLNWSAIFVVKPEGIFGEIVRGLHNQLTQGVMANTPYQFIYDFSNWHWSEPDREAEERLKIMLTMIRVADPSVQKKLHTSLGSTFSHNYLEGYFETTVWPDSKTYFIDYNRVLSAHLPMPEISQAPTSPTVGLVRGVCAHPGIVKGSVVVVQPEQINTLDFPEGSILVTDNTDIRFVPLMKKAAAVVTNRGGLLSHASIVCRELGKPCLVGTIQATELLKTGQRVKVDAGERAVYPDPV